MHKDIQEFLDYIKSARNYSDHTVKSYQNDLIKFEVFKKDKSFSIYSPSLWVKIA